MTTKPRTARNEPRRANVPGSGTSGGGGEPGEFWNSNEPGVPANLISNNSVPPAVSVPRSMLVVPAGSPVSVKVNASLVGVAPEPTGNTPPLAPPAQLFPDELQTSTFMKPGRVCSKTAVGKTVEVVEIPVASGSVSNPKSVTSVPAQVEALNVPCGVVFVIETSIEKLTVPPAPGEKAKFEKTPVADSVLGGIVLPGLLQLDESHDQNTSKAELPAETTMADAGPLTAKPATSGMPIINLRIIKLH